MERIKQKRVTENDVMVAIGLAKQRIMAEGSVDQEFSDLESIAQKVKSQDITPPTALEHIHNLLEGRQNYH